MVRTPTVAKISLPLALGIFTWLWNKRTQSTQNPALSAPHASFDRKEEVRKVVERMLNPNSVVDLQQTAGNWLASVKAHDTLSKGHLFKDKPRGHGQADGSTDGRLLRKLMMASARNAASSDPSFDSYRNDIKAATERLNAAKIALQGNPNDANTQQEHRAAKQNLFNHNKALNEDVASKLDNLLSQTGGSLALKKAIFLTQEKLRDPLGYKQKYARVIPFNDPNDPANPDKWVKASRRFYIPADRELPLPLRSDKTKRDTSVVAMQSPPAGLPNFGNPSDDLIQDVGQNDLSECWLQSSAASLPRQTLGNLLSWRPSYGGEGVTTRLHDENGKPIYIRTKKNQLWNTASNHKALWPAALTDAAAKVSRDELRQFRRTKPRNDRNGMPMYSVRDVYGNTIENAAKLLTGKAPLMSENVANMSPRRKETRIGNLWTRAGNAGITKGVASFGNFKNPNGSDAGPGHAVVFLGIKPGGKIGNFGNTWVNGAGMRSVSAGHKIFNAPISRVRQISFLDPNGANPANDRFIRNGPSKLRHRSRLGNFMP
jgi:hypothetical protein